MAYCDAARGTADAEIKASPEIARNRVFQADHRCGVELSGGI